MGHIAGLDAMDGLLHRGIKILDTKRSAVEAHFVQGLDVVAGEAARINFHPGFNVVRELKMLFDDPAEPSDLIRMQESGGAAAPMQLDDLAVGIHLRGHLRDFMLQVIEIGFTLRMVEGDDRGATAEPTEGLAKRDMEIKGKVASGLVVGGNLF